ncbi:fucolectin-7-like [Ylistrum balloti]|uniref:fucolectin-7-like n=1 Tax=Ylistrum balloti TaxID=509963 RepID=UPI002905ECEE|nr:fucolectin-7-like [Ylistrum balloti]
MLDEDCDSYAFDSSKCYGFTNRIITTTPTTVNLKALYYENKGALGRNLAAGKPSSQNGLYDGHGSQGNYTAKMANDDSRVPEPNGLLGSCSHLGYSSYANTIWWKVDLEDVYRITNVALLARKDPFPSELEHLKIAVGRTSTGNFIDCVVDTGPGFYGEMRSFACTVPITGQYVQVSKYTSGWTFTLCELEVFGEPKP